MLFRLEPQAYWRVQTLYANLQYNLVIDSIIDGNTPAWVYVDDQDTSKTGLMWNKQDALLLAGHHDHAEVNQALNRILVEQVIPHAKQRGIPELSLHYSPQDWEEKSNELLKGLNHQKAHRRYYTSLRPRIDWRSKIPTHCEVRPIDLSLLENEGIGNINQVKGWVSSFWVSFQDYVKTGFGYCLLYQGILVSWCLSVYASGRHYELGLATMPEFQNRGYATLVAAACVDHCAANRFVAHWHCWDGNLSSIAVAEKVGFERPVGYSVYKFNFG
jgi:RimJ/RimL family protein N-acetyltransferase